MTSRRGLVSVVTAPTLLLAVACSNGKNVSTGTTASAGGKG